MSSTVFTTGLFIAVMGFRCDLACCPGRGMQMPSGFANCLTGSASSLRWRPTTGIGKGNGTQSVPNR